jgi:hypothetical protein
MNAHRFVPVLGLVLPAILVLGVLPGRAAATLTQQIDPTTANVGDQVTVTITVQNSTGANIQLPTVDGLPLVASNSATNISFINGNLTSAVSQIFTLVPQRAGDFTIHAFDVHLADGTALHVQAMKLHVVNSGAPSSAGGVATSPGGGGAPAGNGPVVMPPVAVAPPGGGNPGDNRDASINPPLDGDGQPAKVFMLVTAQTTDAYVGQTIPLRIEFFIRMDVLAQQDSLPVIEGSNFLMNDLSVRPAEDEPTLAGNVPYHRETWMTAISAPRSGDFPLQMVRDTYWTKNAQGLFSDPLGNFFGPRPTLAHANIPGNQLTIHVHDLPEEGKPADFTGAIGQFGATGNASPVAVDVGDPVYLDFTVNGSGNFDHVRCPVVASDPAWKSYVPSSKITYNDEFHTQGEKTFRQAIIPQKNGNLPLPAASFSYFDPGTKKYVTLPIELPAVTVTGSAAAPSVAATAGADTSMAASPVSSDFRPNRLEFGTLRAHFAPIYRQPWFWVSQGLLISCILLGGLALFIRSLRPADNSGTEWKFRKRTLQEREEAMSDAVRRDDAPAFFLAARDAVQIQLGAQWGVPPEAVTLPQVAQRDPALAESLGPLFAQADEVMYSGLAPAGIDLAEWERRVRGELLQPATS